MDYYMQIDHKDVTPVHQQPPANTSWAFTVADSITNSCRMKGLTVRNHEEMPLLAAHELLDWLPKHKTKYYTAKKGILGDPAQIIDAYDYICKHGIHTAAAYPNKMKTEDLMDLSERAFSKMKKTGYKCHYKHVPQRVTMGGYGIVNRFENQSNASFVGDVLAQLDYQPVVGGMVCTQEFIDFNGEGIYDTMPDFNDPKLGRHAVLITGYGHEAGGSERQFFEIKNTYGIQWADKGYAKINTEQFFVVFYPTGPAMVSDHS